MSWEEGHLEEHHLVEVVVDWSLKKMWKMYYLHLNCQKAE